MNASAYQTISAMVMIVKILMNAKPKPIFVDLVDFAPI